MAIADQLNPQLRTTVKASRLRSTSCDAFRIDAVVLLVRLCFDT